MNVSALTTDFYELTMAAGYFSAGKPGPAVFDMFFRSHPFGGGFSVFAGLKPLLDCLEELRFTAEDVDYLYSTGFFSGDFLDYLRGFRFRGDVYALPEGTLVFPNEPLLRVHGSIIEAQIIESLLLNVINFQSLIATKAARVFLASNKGTVLEFGLRRAQGVDGAFSASRASYIGGAGATSNTAAGKALGIPAKGTMAHSWVLAFDSELESFKRYAELYPDSSIFLIDTYDTLGSGIENALAVGKMLQERGKSFGVRLDSGDLLKLSREIRRRLDNGGFKDAKIAVSNELDEYLIADLVKAKAPIDIWGVGTRLVTGGSDSSFTGVYKLAAKGNGNIPVMKVSEDEEKSTNPGVKQVYRINDEKGVPLRDLIALEEENIETAGHTAAPLLRQCMREGRVFGDRPSLREIRERLLAELHRCNPEILRIEGPAVYPVELSADLLRLKRGLMP